MAGMAIGWLVGSTDGHCRGCDEFRDRFVVLAISVVYHGCAVPVAWQVLEAQEKHAWKPEWQALLRRFQGLLPEGWMVIVLAGLIREVVV
jgi:hypothetical protein